MLKEMLLALGPTFNPITCLNILVGGVCVYSTSTKEAETGGRTLATLLEDLGSMFSSHMAGHICRSSCSESICPLVVSAGTAYTCYNDKHKGQNILKEK